MDVANSSESRPEDVLHEMAAGSEEIGARLLRLADTAAAVHRGSILDLLLDDSPAPQDSMGAPSDLIREQASAISALPLMEERESGSLHGCDVHVAAVVRHTEVA